MNKVFYLSIVAALAGFIFGFDTVIEESVLFYLYIFILFRFFDIKKPFPINYFDKNFKNSFGVIMDDVIAGFYVVLTLILFMIIKSKLFT